MDFGIFGNERVCGTRNELGSERLYDVHSFESKPKVYEVNLWFLVYLSKGVTNCFLVAADNIVFWSDLYYLYNVLPFPSSAWHELVYIVL